MPDRESSQESLVSERKGWRNKTGKEKAYIGAVAAISVIAVVLLVVLGVVTYQYVNKEDSVTEEEVTEATGLPPWLTYATETTTVQPPPTTTTRSPGWDRCQKTECALAAAQLLNSITKDPNVTPCNDFYNYACGSWLEDNQLGEQLSEWNEKTAVSMDFKENLKVLMQNFTLPFGNSLPAGNLTLDYYNLCKSFNNQNNYTSLRNVIDNVFDEIRWSQRLASVKLRFNGDYLWSVYSQPDQTNTLDENGTDSTIYLGQPTFGISIKSLLQEGENSEEAIRYIELLRTVWKIVFGDTDQETALIAIQIFQFEKKLASMLTPKEDLTNRFDSYNVMTISELDELGKFYNENRTEEFSWSEYLPLVILSGPRSLQFSNETTVVVTDVDYFEQLNDELTTMDPEILEQYLKWRIIFSIGEHATLELYEIFREWRQGETGITVPLSRDDECLDWTRQHFGHVIIAAYNHWGYFNETLKTEVTQIITNLRNTFKADIRTYSWLSEGMRNFTTEKLDSLTVDIGFPAWLMNEVYLDTSQPYNLAIFYEGLKFSRFPGVSTDHFTVTLDLISWKSLKSRQNYFRERDPNWFSWNPAELSAHYSPITNTLSIPAPIVSSRWIIPAVKHLTYGRMGVIVAREMTRVLDVLGIQYRPNGTLAGEVEDELLASMEEKTLCFVNQYNLYQETITGLKVDGKRTRDENIADSTGFNLALKAYIRSFASESSNLLPGVNLNKEQLFIMSYAQSQCTQMTRKALEVHMNESSFSPNQFRVNGVLRNSLQFPTIWTSCLSPPKDECALWPIK